jgi:hypothetical protein
MTSLRDSARPRMPNSYSENDQTLTRRRSGLDAAGPGPQVVQLQHTSSSVTALSLAATLSILPWHRCSASEIRVTDQPAAWAGRGRGPVHWPRLGGLQRYDSRVPA